MNSLNLLICICIITFVGLCTGLIALAVMWARGRSEEEPIVRGFGSETPEYDKFMRGTQWSRDDLERLPPNVKPLFFNRIAGMQPANSQPTYPHIPASDERVENPGADGRKAVAPGVAGEQL